MYTAPYKSAAYTKKVEYPRERDRELKKRKNLEKELSGRKKGEDKRVERAVYIG